MSRRRWARRLVCAAALALAAFLAATARAERGTAAARTWRDAFTDGVRQAPRRDGPSEAAAAILAPKVP